MGFLDWFTGSAPSPDSAATYDPTTDPSTYQGVIGPSDTVDNTASDGTANSSGSGSSWYSSLSGVGSDIFTKFFRGGGTATQYAGLGNKSEAGTPASSSPSITSVLLILAVIAVGYFLLMKHKR